MSNCTEKKMDHGSQGHLFHCEQWVFGALSCTALSGAATKHYFPDWLIMFFSECSYRFILSINRRQYWKKRLQTCASLCSLFLSDQQSNTHPSISDPHVSSEGAGVDPSRHWAKKLRDSQPVKGWHGHKQPFTLSFTPSNSTITCHWATESLCSSSSKPKH